MDEDFVPNGDVGVQEVAGGKYAVYTYVGPYENMAGIFAKLCGQWLPQNGYEIRAEPTLQIYKNDHRTTKSEELVTEIYIPIE